MKTENENINIKILLFLISISILTISISAASATSTTPPASITNLHVDQYSSNFIKWVWTDPTTSDFSHVDVYINGIFKANVLKNTKYYNATGLLPGNTYKISTHTVDSYGNINKTWVNNTQNTATLLRFITVGDPHLTSDTNTDQYKRFTRVINYINNRSDVDLVVIMGDIVDSATTSNFDAAKAALNKLHKTYFVIKGNHDGVTTTKFEQYFGSSKHIENINGYQLLFIGIMRDSSGINHWSFDFSLVDKSKPTIIFNHGPVQPKPGATSCINSWGSFYGYSCDLKSQVDSFSKLVGYFAGHVHTGTNQYIGNELYVTSDNIGGNGDDSDYIGYTVVQKMATSYSLVRY